MRNHNSLPRMKLKGKAFQHEYYGDNLGFLILVRFQVTPRGHSLREDAAASRQHKDLRRQLETANDELYKV